MASAVLAAASSETPGTYTVRLNCCFGFGASGRGFSCFANADDARKRAKTTVQIAVQTRLAKGSERGRLRENGGD